MKKSEEIYLKNVSYSTGCFTQSHKTFFIVNVIARSKLDRLRYNKKCCTAKNQFTLQKSLIKQTTKYIKRTGSYVYNHNTCFLFNLQMGPISQSVCKWQASPAQSYVKLQLIGLSSLWKSINCKQSARWQYLSRLKASAFFSLQKNLVSCIKCNNLYSGLVTPSSG